MRAGERYQLLGAIAVLRSCAVLFAELPFQHIQQARMEFQHFLYLRAKQPPFGVDRGHLIICQDQMTAAELAHGGEQLPDAAVQLASALFAVRRHMEARTLEADERLGWPAQQADAVSRFARGCPSL